MKKISIIVAAAFTAMSLAACGASKTTVAASTESGAESGTKAAGEAGTVPESFRGKTLVMATNAEFEPYEYHEGKDIVGIDVDIMTKICEKLGASLEISDMAFDSIIPAVQAGKADFGMAGMTVSPDREKNVDFTDSYATSVQSVIVKGSAIQSLEDMKGKKIGVQQGTTGDIFATDDFGEANVNRFPAPADAVQALSAGKIDAVLIDQKTAEALVSANESLTVLATPYAEEEYAICTKKGNEELVKAINLCLREMKSDGSLDSIIEKYIKAE